MTFLNVASDFQITDLIKLKSFESVIRNDRCDADVILDGVLFVNLLFVL